MLTQKQALHKPRVSQSGVGYIFVQQRCDRRDGAESNAELFSLGVALRSPAPVWVFRASIDSWAVSSSYVRQCEMGIPAF